MVHITSSEVKELKLEKAQDEGLKEALAYVENYCNDNGFRLVNFDKESGYYCFMLAKDS
ncbi:MAG: hypothetical protein ACFFCS_23075 [Candidatus Hodarchaeota archaeon]